MMKNKKQWKHFWWHGSDWAVSLVIGVLLTQVQYIREINTLLWSDNLILIYSCSIIPLTLYLNLQSYCLILFIYLFASPGNRFNSIFPLWLNFKSRGLNSMHFHSIFLCGLALCPYSFYVFSPNLNITHTYT